MTLQEAADELGNIGLDILEDDGDFDCTQRDKTGSCIQHEEARPLTKLEKDSGWALRPFFAYDEEKLCAACRVFWHIERAEQIVHDMKSLKARTAARQQ